MAGRSGTTALEVACPACAAAIGVRCGRVLCWARIELAGRLTRQANLEARAQIKEPNRA